MSTFWSDWVMALVVLNMGVVFFLFIWAQRVKIPTQADGTSGHVWGDRVREGVHRLPTWWVLLSAVAWAAAIGYLVLYPGFGANKGLLGWTSHEQLGSEIAANDAKLAPVLKNFDGRSVEQLAATPEATRIGYRLFADNCAACHGLKGHGTTAVGAPDLTDADWLWGGTPEAIMKSILDGRTGVMPPMGAAVGTSDDVHNVAEYVLSLSNYPHDSVRASLGRAKFVACAACHGPEGKGNPMLGAPNLTYPKRLYGNGVASIARTITDGRTGTMPAWRQRLSESEVRLIAAWVYAQSHGGSSPATR